MRQASVCRRGHSGGLAIQAGRPSLHAQPACNIRLRLSQRHGLHVPRTASLEVAQPSAPETPESQQKQQADASNKPQAQEQQQQPSSSFSWTKQWWPIAVVSYLDKKKPSPVTLLGHTYVVWFDPKADTWRVMEDRCPHRLAPLSEGRIDQDGTLMCSYHGWQFNGSGACTRIPQIGDPEKMKAACGSSRACVASFPTTVVDGLLYAWLESGPAAEAEAAAKQIYKMPELEGSGVPWNMTEHQVDYTFWLEQGMDPTHANFLHHTCGFPMSDALPMPGEALKANDIQLEQGYLWTHGNYSKKNAGMKAERQFVPPNSLRVVYDKGFVRGFATMGVPVRPGISRVFARFAFGPPAGKGKETKTPLLFQLLGKMPHWARPMSPLADQDSVMNAKQEAYMRSLGLTPKDYAAFARADQGVMAANRWFEAAGYEQMWQQRLGSSSDSSSNGVGARYAYKPFTPKKSEAEYFNWYDRHTKHCAECQAGMKLLEQAANAASVAALLLVVAAASFAAAAKTVFSPAVALFGLLSAGTVWLRQQLLNYRHDQFINSSYKWQKYGGLSLVQGDPIRI